MYYSPGRIGGPIWVQLSDTNGWDSHVVYGVCLSKYVWAKWCILDMVRHGRALTNIGYMKLGRHDQAQMDG